MFVKKEDKNEKWITQIRQIGKQNTHIQQI